MVRRRSFRRERPGSERGATLFVVVLAITLLTGIGLFTVHSSTLLARAAGNEREAMQTTYFAELATLTSLSLFASNPQAFTDLAVRAKDICPANMGKNTTPAYRVTCAKVSSDTIPIPNGATLTGPDSFGPALAITGAFETQTTDVFDGGRVPGMVVTFDGNPAHWAYRDMKLTTTATLQPVAAGTACVNNVMQTAGQHLTRAHASVGPVYVPGQ